MAKSEKSVEELVSMIERGELRHPEMQRRYVWRSTRVRDLMDSLYRGYPSGAILLWETDEAVPLQDFAVEQQANAYQTKLLLLDGQQRLTSLAALLKRSGFSAREADDIANLAFTRRRRQVISCGSHILLEALCVMFSSSNSLPNRQQGPAASRGGKLSIHLMPEI